MLQQVILWNQYSIYTTLPSDDLDMEEENHLEVMMQKMELTEVEIQNRDVETISGEKISRQGVL